ncbi:MAG: VOC family protein, partial [Ktedonobacterales bacterium]
AERLDLLETPVTRGEDGEVRFADPEGLGHELVLDTSGDAPLSAEHPEIPAEHALRGFEGVRAYATDPEHSGALLEQLLGATRTGPSTGELRGERRGGWIAYDEAPAEPGRQSGGIVHHVAWGTSVADHPRWQERFEQSGLRTSGIIDRTYFKSIYFREPNGILFELATDGPGFLSDEEEAHLGERLALPPFLEPDRAQIEAGLHPLPTPNVNHPATA